MSLAGSRLQNGLLCVAGSCIEKMQHNSFALGHMGGLWRATTNSIRSESPAKQFRYFTSCINTIVDIMEIVYANNDVVNDPSLLKWITGFVFQPMEWTDYLGEDNVILMAVFQPPETPVGAGGEELLTSAMSERCHVTFCNAFFCSGDQLAVDPGD